MYCIQFCSHLGYEPTEYYVEYPNGYSLYTCNNQIGLAAMLDGKVMEHKEDGSTIDIYIDPNDYDATGYSPNMKYNKLIQEGIDFHWGCQELYIGKTVSFTKTLDNQAPEITYCQTSDNVDIKLDNYDAGTWSDNTIAWGNNKELTITISDDKYIDSVKYILTTEKEMKAVVSYAKEHKEINTYTESEFTIKKNTSKTTNNTLTINYPSVLGEYYLCVFVSDKCGNDILKIAKINFISPDIEYTGLSDIKIIRGIGDVVLPFSYKGHDNLNDVKLTISNPDNLPVEMDTDGKKLTIKTSDPNLSQGDYKLTFTCNNGAGFRLINDDIKNEDGTTITKNNSFTINILVRDFGVSIYNASGGNKSTYPYNVYYRYLDRTDETNDANNLVFQSGSYWGNSIQITTNNTVFGNLFSNNPINIGFSENPTNVLETKANIDEGCHTPQTIYMTYKAKSTDNKKDLVYFENKTYTAYFKIDQTAPSIKAKLNGVDYIGESMEFTSNDKLTIEVSDENTKLGNGYSTEVSGLYYSGKNSCVRYLYSEEELNDEPSYSNTSDWSILQHELVDRKPKGEYITIHDPIDPNKTKSNKDQLLSANLTLDLSDAPDNANYLYILAYDNNKNIKYGVVTLDKKSIPAKIPSDVTTLQIQHGQILDSALRNYVFYTDDTHTTKVSGKWEAKMYTEAGVRNVTAAIPASEAGDSYPNVTYTFTPTDDYADTYGEVSYTVESTKIIMRRIYVSGMNDINVFSSATGNAEIKYTAVDDCGTDMKEFVVPKSDNGNLVIGSLPNDRNSRPVYILEIKDNAEITAKVSPAIADGKEGLTPYTSLYKIVAEEGKEIPSITVTAMDVKATYNNGDGNQKTTVSGFKDIQYVNSLEISSPFTEHDVALGVDGQWDPASDSETHTSLSGLAEGRYSLDAISAWAHLNYTGSNPEWLKLENLGSANDILVYDHTKPELPEIEITSQDIFEGDNDITFQISASDVVTDPSGQLPSCIRSITYWIDEDQATEISAGPSDPTSSEYQTETITITAGYLKALPEGTTHTIYARAEDNAGNISDIAHAYFYIPTDRDIEMERDTFVFTYQEPKLNITGIHNYGNPIKGAVIVAVDDTPTNEPPYTWSIADGNCQWDNEQQSLVMDVPGTDVFKMRTGVYYTMNLVSARKTSPSFVVRRTWELSDDLVLDKDSALAATDPDGYCNQNPVNVEIMLKENYSLRPEGVVYIRHKDSTETHAYIMNENGLFRITDGEEFKGFTFNADEDKMPEGTNMYELIFADDELQNDPNLSEPVNMRAKMKVASGKIQKLYEDVLYVNNSLGLYRDNEYQWYQDEEEIMNWNNQFIELSQSYEELSGQNVKIYANVIMDKTGEKVESCQAPSNSKIISYGEGSLMKRAPAPSISAYPNPAKAFAAITIKLTNISESRLDKCSIQIHNQMGAMVKTITNIRESNTTALPSGIYTISLINNGKITKSTKIIVE
ncbi:MAG: T9SS type A sorting domain-containing protein [Bacteroidales bacterium]|nr:T9SS type A sorting domain-containing protein [Bacteroidales bacterium]